MLYCLFLTSWPAGLESWKSTLSVAQTSHLFLGRGIQSMDSWWWTGSTPTTWLNQSPKTWRFNSNHHFFCTKMPTVSFSSLIYTHLHVIDIIVYSCHHRSVVLWWLWVCQNSQEAGRNGERRKSEIPTAASPREIKCWHLVPANKSPRRIWTSSSNLKFNSMWELFHFSNVRRRSRLFQ